MSKKKIKCTLCTEKKIANDIIICPHCSVEICEPCFQYGLTMEIQDPLCIYCKKGLNIEFILANLESVKSEKNNPTIIIGRVATKRFNPKK